MADGEHIARFLLSKRQFSPSNRTVKYGAYLPAPNGQTSVFRVSNLSEKETWEIGSEYVAKPRNKTLYAKGETTAAVIKKNGLAIVPDTLPHPLHANIVNWPTERDEQKMLAVEIANEATLAIR